MYGMFRNFINTVMRHNCHDYIGDIWNYINLYPIWKYILYRSYKIFIENIYFIRILYFTVSLEAMRFINVIKNWLFKYLYDLYILVLNIL